MKKKPLFIGAMALVVIGTALTVSFAGTRAVTQPTTLHVVEHSLTDKVTDTGKPGDSVGRPVLLVQPGVRRRG